MAGVWSDGVNVWVVDPSRKLIFSYDSPHAVVNFGWDFQRLDAAGNASPHDIWSDGVTMWVADSEDGKIYSYNMRASENAELRSLNAADQPLPGFGPDTHSYSLDVASTVNQATVEAIPRQFLSTASYAPEDADTNLEGHQVNLSTGANTVTITVLAQDGITTEEYTVTINRGDSEPFGWTVIDDFETLDTADSQYPSGLASDDFTMWEADLDDLQLYAFDIDTKVHKPDLDIDLDAANGSPSGLWYDGAAIRAYDRSAKMLYAYDAETGGWERGKDLDWSGARLPLHTASGQMGIRSGLRKEPASWWPLTMAPGRGTRTGILTPWMESRASTSTESGQTE